MDEYEGLTGSKLSQIQAGMLCPIVPAYGHGFLKGEKAVQDRIGERAFDVIVRRPLTVEQLGAPGAVDLDAVRRIGRAEARISAATEGQSRQGSQIFLGLGVDRGQFGREVSPSCRR